ncbi:Mur ligase family protein, partial [Cellulosimicrobium cellulans]|uniref:Mur ligase family protein n=1 Tax=Cellulosimicrobium cellulans TaxID=1710 RepID=UPI002240E8EA
LHRSQALASLMARGRSVAVAGAHGKTTTSAMIATVLRGAGLDPSFAIGGTVLTEDGPVAGGHLGSDVLVAEADESDGSFLNYAPDVAVVTNVEPDHLDHYGSRAAFEQAFVDFAARIVPGGTLVACADDAGARALASSHARAGGAVVTYGTSADADVRVADVAPIDEAGRPGVRASLTGTVGAARLDGLELLLRVPGHHNALNATAAVVTAVV